MELEVEYKDGQMAMVKASQGVKPFYVHKCLQSIVLFCVYWERYSFDLQN